jgi:DNA-binding response OmpR family regulator
MASLANTRIYIAIRKPEDRSKLEDQLVLDGSDVSTFSSASGLWDTVQARPARLIVTDQRFGGEFDGLELVRRIRKYCPPPYIYILMRSMREQMKDIQEGLRAGADGYLVKPHHRFQIRSQVLVALRWLTYIDSVNADAKSIKTRLSARQAAPSAPTKEIKAGL